MLRYEVIVPFEIFILGRTLAFFKDKFDAVDYAKNSSKKYSWIVAVVDHEPIIPEMETLFFKNGEVETR